MIKINYPTLSREERPLRFADMKIGDTIYGDLEYHPTLKGTFLRTFSGWVFLDNPEHTWSSGCSNVFKPGARFVNLDIYLLEKGNSNV